jgi:death-on-curing protein
MEVFLVLNGYEVNAGVDKQEKLFLDMAAGKISRSDLPNGSRNTLSNIKVSF